MQKSSEDAERDRRRDVQMLQTAASLELVALATYRRARRLPSLGGGAAGPFVGRLLDAAVDHHEQHRQAFDARAEVLGGRPQRQPNPRYQDVVDDAPLREVIDVVNLAIVLEEAAAESYVSFLGQLADVDFRTTLASVAGVEGQHLAAFRAVGTLLRGDAGALARVPLVLDSAPLDIGTAPFPDAFGGTGRASPPEEGAIDRTPQTTTTAPAS